MSTPRLLSHRYELGEVLGHGSMSEVRKGRDVRLGRDVAVKMLNPELARDPEYQERFRREAQAIALLDHPAIVAVYDTGETKTELGPTPYIVMEYVDGRTLRDVVRTSGALPAQRAVEIMADVCAALDFIHRQGIVHRDVKPGNVMLTRSGAVKVKNSSIATSVGTADEDTVIGTAQYLSPEQARGEALDGRTDVYAAGCVLFELLTGEPPFIGDSPVAVAYRHVREEPRPPSALNPRVSPALDAIVLKALSKGVPDRYQSAADMRTDLHRALAGRRPQALATATLGGSPGQPTGFRPAAAVPTRRPAPEPVVRVKGADVLRLSSVTQYEEPHGENVYTFDNSGSSSTSVETIRVAHTARVEVAVHMDKARTIGGNAGVKFLDVAAMQGRIQSEVLSKYSLDLKSELVFEQTTAINIPAATHVRVVFRWIRVWDRGVAVLGQRAEELAEVPYSVTIGLRFDKKTSDIS